MFSGFSDFRFLLQSTSKETKQLRQLNIFVLHVPVRCLITAKVSTHPLCWRPVCLCVCLPVCLSLTMRPLGSNLLTSPLKIASSAGILVQFTTPPGAQTDTLIPQAERSFHRRANISSVSGSGLSPSSPISSTCFTPLLVFNAVDTERGDAVELTAVKIDLSCERRDPHARKLISGFERDIHGGALSVKISCLFGVWWDLWDLKVKPFSSLLGILGQLVCCCRAACGVNPRPRCPLTPSTTALSTCQGEGLSQRKHPEHGQVSQGGKSIRVRIKNTAQEDNVRLLDT